MDEAGARAHLHNLEVPKHILKIELDIENTREKKENKVSAQLFEDAAKLRDKERKLVKKLSNAQKVWQNEENKSRVSIDSEMIADVVSIMTGIPYQK